MLLISSRSTTSPSLLSEVAAAAVAAEAGDAPTGVGFGGVADWMERGDGVVGGGGGGGTPLTPTLDCCS